MRDLLKGNKSALSHEAILRALFENYESIYDIDVETDAYHCYHESESYSDLCVARGGEDFFGDMIADADRIVYAEDREYVKHALLKDVMVDNISRDKYYSIVYRLVIDGEPVYHKIRATMGKIDGRDHILIGVRNVDETIRQEKAHEEALSAMHQKEKNHLEAVLAGAAGYLEANLTTGSLSRRRRASRRATATTA